MARVRRRSRAPAGRTERRSRRGHHPAGTAGKVRADAPRDTRRTGYSPIKKTLSALPPSGEYGGAGGVEGQPPLSPHAPRRAGDPPPVPGSSRKTRKNKTNDRQENLPLTPCPTPGRRPTARSGQQPQCKEEEERKEEKTVRRTGDLPPTPGNCRNAGKNGKKGVREEEKKEAAERIHPACNK